MTDLFLPYQKAHDAYISDVEQLSGIGRRLLDSARSTDAGAKLLTIKAQMDKLPTSLTEARMRYDSAIDKADADIVDKFRALCAYALGTGQADAGVSYLLGECKAFADAKGNFQLRRALFDSIGDVATAVATAAEKNRPCATTAGMDQLSAITDPEARTAYFNKNRASILAAFEARATDNSTQE